MNLIFLDVDGVLNSTRKLIEVYNITHKPHSGSNYPFDEECLKNLQLIVLETNSKIVISSTWRKHKKNIQVLFNELKKYNLDKEVIGFTKVIDGNLENEILEYLSNIEIDYNFIILEDSLNFSTLLPHLVATKTYFGLTYENALLAIDKLNSKKRILKKD